VDRNELRCLQDDVGGLRGEMLALAEVLERAQEEAVVQQALAESLKVRLVAVVGGGCVAEHS
jgi:hypothetical protein